MRPYNALMTLTERSVHAEQKSCLELSKKLLKSLSKHEILTI